MPLPAPVMNAALPLNCVLFMTFPFRLADDGMDAGSAEVDGPAGVRPPLVLGCGVPHHAGGQAGRVAAQHEMQGRLRPA